MTLCLLSWSHSALTWPDSDSEMKLTHLVLDGFITGAQSFGLTPDFSASCALPVFLGSHLLMNTACEIP